MRISDGMVIYHGEDDTCYVNCVCGCEEALFVSSSEITKCPKCRRGYRTEFTLWVYGIDEDDPVYKNKWEQ